MAVSEYWGVPTQARGKLSKDEIERMKVRDLPEDLADRFTDREKALYEVGLCGERVEYGNGGIGTWCGEQSSESCVLGMCSEHHGAVCTD